MLLESLGHEDAATDVRSAVERTLDAGPRTPDLGGTASTDEVADDVIARL